jgi:GMP synthase (glutamine-hydrolysing)
MILIIDFGSQYNQLIVRRVREARVYCRIEPPSITINEIKKIAPKGIILSGGPLSIYEENAVKLDKKIFDLNIPTLGICYGMHFMIDAFGGVVKKADKKEYGLAKLFITNENKLLANISDKIDCWMSHGDSVETLPQGFSGIASTDNTYFAAVANEEKKLFGLQFHPEVLHTQKGKVIIKNFVKDICGCKQNWTMTSFIKNAVNDIKNITKDKKVILGLSGGVDSSVAAVLIDKAVGENLTSIFIDNGLLRKNEAKDLRKIFKNYLDINVVFVDAKERFLSALKGVIDPEEKRKIIGRIFIEVFEDAASKIENVEFLAQGTLYPDVIESVSAFGGPSSVIKSHHNVGGLPDNMKLTLIEPLRYLFKDEVRKLGKSLSISENILLRHPFPGPGLAIRIIGEITEKRLEILKETDAVFIEEIKKSGYYKKVWQAFAVLLPIKSVGVMGDHRTYENIVAIRAVTCKDGMTADWAKLPHKLLANISNRIINEVNGVNRVVYDISSKPPSTIEWE